MLRLIAQQIIRDLINVRMTRIQHGFGLHGLLILMCFCWLHASAQSSLNSTTTQDSSDAAAKEKAPAVVFNLPVTAPAFSSPPSAAPSPEPLSPSDRVATPSADDLWLHAQIALTRRRFSCGPIDGVSGAQTAAALYAFQESDKLPKTGELDAETRARLFTQEEPLVEITLTAEDFVGLQPLSPTWLGKSQQSALGHETIQELIAERFHTSPALLQKLNPTVIWDTLLPGAKLIVPAIQLPLATAKAARLHIRLADRTLQVRAANDALIAHFPVSIAQKVEKRPEGELHVTIVIENPDYTFNPALFSESEEARTIDHKLIIQPGPNNPVGVAWIGLDREGYGIHGTPNPEKVGRTESHGCFRLANWDARTLLAMAWKGLPVLVDP